MLALPPFSTPFLTSAGVTLHFGEVAADAFVGGLVDEEAVDQLAEQPGMNHLLDDIGQRSIPLDEVRNADEVAVGCQAGELLRFGNGRGRGLFNQHGLARFEGCFCIAEVRGRRRGDVHQIDVTDCEHGIDLPLTDSQFGGRRGIEVGDGRHGQRREAGGFCGDSPAGQFARMA